MSVTLADRYPAVHHADSTSEDEKSAYDALRKEMAISKPRKDIFLPLMKSTFSLRRHYILHDALSVKDILKDYPAGAMCKHVIQTGKFLQRTPFIISYRLYGSIPIKKVLFT